jgi:hypothetical protein
VSPLPNCLRAAGRIPERDLIWFRHLRYLLKAAEELISKAPTVADLQNQATTSSAVTSAIRAELAVVVDNQNLDHAKTEEERDGRLNER